GVLELLGHASERPVQLGRREVDAAEVGVGAGLVEAVGAGAYDDAEDDAVVEVVLGHGVEGVGEVLASRLAPHGELLAPQARLPAVGEADAVGVAVVAGGADDDGDGPARALLTPAPGERDAGDDLRPLRQDDVRLGHGSAPLPV